MTEVWALSAEAMGAGFRRGALSPMAVLQGVTERVARLNPAFNAFAVLDPGAARAAGESARRWRAGRPLGGLDGVPVTVSDLLDVAGVPMRRGSRTTSVVAAELDGPLVVGLRANGAVLLGKTAVSEFGWAVAGGGPLGGLTRSPWNPALAASGAAAAGVAGFGVLHAGLDTGGALRVAAGWAGLVGLVPTAGRVPCWPPGPFGGVPGVLARGVRDAALGMSAVARHDWRDPGCLPDEPRDWLDGIEDGVAGMRVAVLRHPGSEAALYPAGVEAVEEAARVLHEAGAELEEVDPALPDCGRVWGTLWRAAAARAVELVAAEKRGMLDPALLLAAEEAAPGGVAVLDALAERERAGHAMARLFGAYDLVLCPTVAGPAPVAEAAGGEHAAWCLPFTLTGQPVAAVPVGLDADGMPRSVQLAAARFRDDLVLRAARVLDRVQPPLPYPGASA